MFFDQTVPEHSETRFVPRLRPTFGIQVMARVDPSLPLEPQRTRPIGVQIVLDLEAHHAGERLRARSDQQMMVGVLHHGLGHQ